MFKKLQEVLVVDDAPDQRLLLEMILQALGLTVLTAEDGLQAMNILKKRPIHLIITDYDMPRVNGEELIHWCRSHSLYVPIVLLSANFEPLGAEKMMSLDCCSILIRKKPVDFGLLTRAVQAADQHGHYGDCAFRSFKQALAEDRPGVGI